MGIRWTEVELTDVARETARKMNFNPAMTMFEAAKSAQLTMLLNDRMKPEQSLALLVYSKQSEFRKLVTSLLGTPQKAIDTIPPVTFPEVKPQTIQSQPEHTATIDFAKIFAPIEEAYRSYLRQTLTKIHQEELERAATEFATQLAATPIAAKKPPKIVVCGPKGNQQTILNGEFRDVLNLVFVEDSPVRAGNAVKHAAGCVLWTNYISHSLQESVKHNAKCPVHLVTGGISSITEELMKFIQ